MLMLRTNPAVRNTRAAQLILFGLKDQVRRDKSVPDYNRASGFMKLEMAIQHLAAQLLATPEAWWCSECDRVGCEHAARHAQSQRRSVRASVAC